jgi:PKD repeat protein
MIIPNCVRASPTIILSDDFESDFSKWTNGYPTHITISTEQAHGGSHSAKVDTSGNYIVGAIAPALAFPFQVDVWFYVDSLASSGHFRVITFNQAGSWPVGPTIDVVNNGGNYELQNVYYTTGWNYAKVCDSSIDAWHHLYINAASWDSFTIWYDNDKQGTTWTGSGPSTPYTVSQVWLLYSTADTVSYIDDFVLETGASDPVTTPPPVADFSGTPTSGNPGLNVTFTDATTNSPTNWTWDFGDGSALSYLESPSHIYTTAGTYTVGLEATNAGGISWANKTGYIFIRDIVPVYTNSPALTAKPTVAWSYTPTFNQPVSLSLLTKPSWASLSSGTISGTPNSLGVFAFKTNATVGAEYADLYWNVTVAGWGPSFVGSILTSSAPNGMYSVSLNLNETGNITMITGPSWLSLTHNGTASSPWVLQGIPTVYGAYNIQLEAFSANGLRTSYLNTTVWIAEPNVNVSTNGMILAALVAGFAIFFTALGYRDGKIWFVAAFLWIVGGLVAFFPINPILLLIALIPGIYYFFMAVTESW